MKLGDERRAAGLFDVLRLLERRLAVWQALPLQMPGSHGQHLAVSGHIAETPRGRTRLRSLSSYQRQLIREYETVLNSKILPDANPKPWFGSC